MILGSIYYIAKDFKDWTKENIMAIIFGIAMGVAISLMSPAKENDNLWFVFFCGIIGVSGMTLPGLSGSFVLILMGNYVLLLVDSVNELFQTLKDVLTWNFDFLNDPNRMRYLKIITSFTLGSVFGLVVSSHIIGYLLKKWHQIVTSLIIGFIAGSLGIVWPWKKEIYKMEEGVILLDTEGNKIIMNYQRYFPDLSDISNWIAVGFILIGIVILIVLERYGDNIKTTS